jgi:hypothetical protein
MSPKVDLGTGIALEMLAVYVYLVADKMPKVKLGIGPGGYPTVVAIGLAILGAALIIQSLLRIKKIPGEKKYTPYELLKVAILAAMVAGYIEGMRYAGFVVMTPIFLLAAMYMYGLRKPLKMVVISIVATVVVYVLFNKFFLVLLPQSTIF